TYSDSKLTSFCLSLFFNNSSTTKIYTLSLHDALPISLLFQSGSYVHNDFNIVVAAPEALRISRVMERDGMAEAQVRARMDKQMRSEEHTSELQSRENLVCRLLLEKKKNTKRKIIMNLC